MIGGAPSTRVIRGARLDVQRQFARVQYAAVRMDPEPGHVLMLDMLNRIIKNRITLLTGEPHG